MEEAFELSNYLPLSFKSSNEQEYMTFLWDAFDTNYTNEKFQFAYLAYHMLSMSFIYFNIWQIQKIKRSSFEMGLIGFRKDHETTMLKASSPFDYSMVNESSILRVLKLIGLDNSKIGTYAKLVQARNDSTHSNGNIYFKTQSALDIKITEILRVADEIQRHSKPIIEDCYQQFLCDNQDPEEWEYSEAENQIQEVFVHENYLSLKDIDFCKRFDIEILVSEKGIDIIRELHGILCASYGSEEGE